MDFALAFAIVHEVPDKDRFFKEINCVLKTRSKLMFAEPKVHVSEKDFNDSIKLAEEEGFTVVNRLYIRRSHAVLLEKK